MIAFFHNKKKKNHYLFIAKAVSEFIFKIFLLFQNKSIYRYITMGFIIYLGYILTSHTSMNISEFT